MTDEELKWEWFGQAGHFCASYDCRFHLHTHIGRYCISTVGEYFPRGGDKQDTVGVGRLYETMVFEIGRDEEFWNEMIMRGYNDRESADAGHMEICLEWSKKA